MRSVEPHSSCILLAITLVVGSLLKGLPSEFEMKCMNTTKRILVMEIKKDNV